MFVLYSKNGGFRFVGELTNVLQEIVRVSNKDGDLIDIQYADKERAIKLTSEGYYCNFDLYLTQQHG